MSSRLLERINIVEGIVPVDLQDGDNNGDWVNMKDYERIVVLFFSAVGTAGDDPTLTIEQATDVSGAGAKALDFTDIYRKQAATDLSSVTGWTKTTQAAANTFTNATSAEEDLIWAVEFKMDELDVDNGFDTIRATVADVGGNAQLGLITYLLGDSRYPDAPENLQDPLVD